MTLNGYYKHEGGPLPLVHGLHVEQLQQQRAVCTEYIICHNDTRGRRMAGELCQVGLTLPAGGAVWSKRTHPHLPHHVASRQKTCLKKLVCCAPHRWHGDHCPVGMATDGPDHRTHCS